MPNREIFTDKITELEVHPGEAGSVTISMKRADMEEPVSISLGKDDVDALIKTLSDRSNEMPSIVSIR